MKLTWVPTALCLACVQHTVIVPARAAEAGSDRAAQASAVAKPHSGNPVFSGWYADPEAVIFGNEYWIYPTFSAPYDQQVFFDAFSSSDLVHWTKHSRILDTNHVTWARRAMWAPAIAERNGKFYFFFG